MPFISFKFLLKGFYEQLFQRYAEKSGDMMTSILLFSLLQYISLSLLASYSA